MIAVDRLSDSFIPVHFPEVEAAPTKHPIFLKIRELASLRKGWHFGEGRQSSELVVELAERIAETALQRGLDRLGAFPGKTGQITIVVYAKGQDHSFQIQPDSSVTYWDEADIERDDEEITFLMAIERIKTISWTSFFTFTAGTGIPRQGAFVAKHLSPLATKPAFPWLITSVLSGPADQFAITPANSIQLSAQSLPFSGNFPAIFFPQPAS